MQSLHRTKHIMIPFATIAILAGSLLLCAAQRSGRRVGDGEGPAYGRDAGGTRYSPLTQINKQIVTRLQMAWTYHTGDILNAKDYSLGAFEATPILADGTLYLSTPFSRVIALDTETGKERWTFDPKIKREYPDATDPFTSRGVYAWLDTRLDPGRAGPGSSLERMMDACSRWMRRPASSARISARPGRLTSSTA
jgi:quinoprotein glucose dehydrogenase